MRGRGAPSLIVGFFLLALPARAQVTKQCGERGAPWIRVQSESLTPDFRTPLLMQVRSSLAARHIDVCVSEEDALSPPLATLEVTSVDAETVATTIVVNDGVTRKHVARELDLRGIPPDGRALTIALALDELLRASWAELVLPDARDKAIAAPKVVTDAIVTTPPPPPKTPEVKHDSWNVGVAFAGEHFGEAHDQLGADLRVIYFPWSRFGFHARLGVREGLSVNAPDGEIHSTALVVTAGADLALFPRAQRAGLDLFTEGFVTRVDFSGDARLGVRGNDEAAVAAYLVLGARAWFALHRSLKVFLDVGGGVPLQTVHATDGDRSVTSLAGTLVLADLGISLALGDAQ